ncbi:hypothetical protein BCR41DRAFT_360575, partial [Lobosporangium transversale]
MPTIRTRNQRLTDAIEQRFLRAVEEVRRQVENGDDADLFQLETYANILSFMYRNRYLRPRCRKPYSTELRDRVLDAYNAEDYSGIIRLTPEQFQELAEILGRAPLFQLRKTGDPLANIKIQLKVTLFRLGTKGISIKKVAWVFGCSVGAVHSYTWRCIKAINNLVEQFVVWPDIEEKLEILKWFKENKGFPHML